MSRYTLHRGDSRELLKTLADNSVDSIVTDPPYHLTTGKKGGTGAASVNPNSPAGRSMIGTGFMGMTWDGGQVAHDPALWAEALRVAKPGAWLLAFGGTRTYHRLACAIEDAGWELRDSPVRGHMHQPEDCPWLGGWQFGSGFPKSHNLDNFRGDLICGCDDHLHGLRDDQDDPHGLGEESEDAELQPSLQRRTALAGACEAFQQGALRLDGDESSQLPREDDRLPQSGVEGRSNCLQEARQLQERAVRQGSGLGAADGESGRLHHGTPAGDGQLVRIPADAAGGGASREPRSIAEPAAEPGAVAGQPEPQAGGAWPVCGRCGKPILPRGIGTALKPAWEPIVCARKPFGGTVAENVIKHGTGGLNIDACRIAAPEGVPSVPRGEFSGSNNNMQMAGRNGTMSEPSELGRWPANIIHDGSDEVLAAFPEAPGQFAPIKYDPDERNTQSVYGAMKRGHRPGGFGNVGAEKGDPVPNGPMYMDGGGSAARFFYCAKASQEDREEGIRIAARLFGMSGAAAAAARGEHYDNGDGGVNRTTLRRNIHPTVKPTDLMRYLVRLVTPKRGTVLDLFTGSGSTGKAAMLEGMNFIGFELDQDESGQPIGYIDIARDRIEFALRQGHQPSLLDIAQEA